MIGDRHTLHGYSFTETLHGPFGPDRCVDCGRPTYSVVPTGRIGAGGLEEDTGAGVQSRCTACGRAHHGVGTVPTEVPARGVPSLIDGAARIRHAEPVAPPPVPAPEHTSADPYPDGVPRCLAVGQLQRLAQAHHWRAEVTYARGPWLPARGVPTATVHSLAVRGALGARRFHALYTRPVVEPEAGAKWSCAHVMVLPIEPVGIFPHAGVNDLKEWIIAGGDVPHVWYESIRDRLAAQRERAKATVKARPKKVREDRA